MTRIIKNKRYKSNKFWFPRRGIWSKDLWSEYKQSKDKLLDLVFQEADSLNMNNAELARRARLSYMTVYRLENYITEQPSDTTIFKLLRAVGLTTKFVKVK